MKALTKPNLKKALEAFVTDESATCFSEMRKHPERMQRRLNEISRIAKRTIAQVEAMPDLMEALKVYSALVQGILDTWSRGDLAGAVNGLEDHRDDTDEMLKAAGL
jgi:hypothetical protein